MAIKKGGRQGFWHNFWTAWWQRYPWKLDDDDEPPTKPEDLEKLASVEPGEDDRKEDVEKRLTGVRGLTFSRYGC
jgi:hypothetical protein